MDKLKMQTENIADKNFEMLSKMFPNALTETITGYDDDGKPIVERAIDADVLRQEISCKVVEGKDERYQFTWPDKKKAVLKSNAPISDTLRPVYSQSVNFDKTENIYIEGDNLNVLKLIQETYLGAIKLIYIDPPYNTGKDFLYSDNFYQNINDYITMSGQIDEEKNRLVQNTESNGRFHTDWLNDFYAKIRLSKSLLCDDGILVISIDEKEYSNAKKICDEVYGEKNYFGDIVWEATTQPTNAGAAKFGLQKKTETILIYGKVMQARKEKGFILEQMDSTLSYPHTGKFGPCRFEVIEKSDAGSYNRESMKYKILGQSPREGKRWQIGEATARTLEKAGKIEIVDGVVKRAVYPEDEQDKIQYKPFWSLMLATDVGTAQTGKDELNTIMGAPMGFDTVKPIGLMKKIISYIEKDAIMLDFYSGSGTTGVATMLLNEEDGGNRKFILVQTDKIQDGYDTSDAYKAGYKNICEIAKERLRRVGRQIKKDSVDTGFRVLKLDSSNMKDVYYNPSETQQSLFDTYADNIKEDRTPEDLLFQVMLDLGVLLSSKIEETTIAGKHLFNVADGFLIACFDNNVTEETVKAVAEKKPYYAVFRDSSMANDSVATNFDQIFASISPDTIRKVL